MLADSEKASQMGLSKDKIRYIVNHGLSVFFAEEMTSLIKKCGLYVILFDESMNKVVQGSQMDFMFVYAFVSIKKIVTHYRTSVFLGRDRAEELLNAFQEGTKDLDDAKLLQVFMNGPNITLKLL